MIANDHAMNRSSIELKQGRSVWLRDQPARGDASSAGHEQPIITPLGDGPLTGHAACEVAIIGAGITGALVAERLIAAGVNVLVVDQRPTGCGSTSASTGLIQYELDTTLLELIAKRGQDHAMAAYRVCGDVLRDFPDYLQACGLAHDPAPRDSLYLASHDHELPGFQEEVRARQRCDIDARFVAATELASRYHIHRPGAILSPGSLSIDPYHVTRQLWRRTLAGGLRLHTPCRIVHYDAHVDHVMLRTDEGYDIRAGRVVFATGYETPSFLDVEVTLKTTYAMASQLGVHRPGEADGTLVWESATPYLYVRDGPEQRLIVGGEDDPWQGQLPGSEVIQAKATRLVKKIARLYPGLNLQTAYQWAGVFAQTPDGLPYIGCTRQFPLGYFALGYGGNGILFSFLAGKIILNHFTRQPCTMAPLFRFERD
jgi:glycine/D-amino acid oxidase-like deaminating enzyme